MVSAMRDEMTLISGGRVALDRERQALCRARRRAGVIPVVAEITPETQRLLVRDGYLPENEMMDKAAVARAVSRFIADAVRGWCNE